MSKKILKQLGIILALCLVAETVASLLPVTIPSSVIAILILALLLGVKVLKEEQILCWIIWHWCLFRSL